MNDHYTDHDPATGCGLVVIACVVIAAVLAAGLYVYLGGPLL